MTLNTKPGERAYREERTAQEARRLLVNINVPVSQITFDSERVLYTFEVLEVSA